MLPRQSIPGLQRQVHVQHCFREHLCGASPSFGGEGLLEQETSGYSLQYLSSCMGDPARGWHETVDGFFLSPRERGVIFPLGFLGRGWREINSEIKSRALFDIDPPSSQLITGRIEVQYEPPLAI